MFREGEWSIVVEYEHCTALVLHVSSRTRSDKGRRPASCRSGPWRRGGQKSIYLPPIYSPELTSPTTRSCVSLSHAGSAGSEPGSQLGLLFQSATLCASSSASSDDCRGTP
eukprot:scaffold232304_cov36-Tisochrysis_lutea.AAC.2